MLVSDEQLQKAKSPILVTESGITTSPVHFSASASIRIPLTITSELVSFCFSSHGVCKKALQPIYVTESGIVILVSDVQ